MLMSTIAASVPSIQSGPPAAVAMAAANTASTCSCDFAVTVGSSTGASSLSVTMTSICMEPSIPGPLAITVSVSFM